MAIPSPPRQTSPARIVEIDPLLDGRWDRFVENHPNATGHHLGAWAAILPSCYGYRPKYIALEANSELAGVLPLVNSGPRLSGSRLSSLPTSKAAGPLATSPEHARALLAAAIELKGQEGLSSLMVRSQTPELEGGRARIDSVTFAQALELDRKADDLLDGYKRTSKNLYRNIRKSQKSGVVVIETTSNHDLKEWYRLYLLTIRRLRALPRRLKQLQEAKSRMGARWRLVVVKNDGAVIAGGIFHDIAGTVELIYNASDPDSLSLRPNHALYWHMITDSIDRGRMRFDFGMSDHESLEQFKRQWATTPREVYLYTDGETGDQNPTGDSASVISPGSSHGKAGQASKARLVARAKTLADDALAASPLVVNRAVGSLAYRIM